MLRILGPEATLRRGYSITRDERAKSSASVAEAARTKIKTRVSRWRVRFRVVANESFLTNYGMSDRSVVSRRIRPKCSHAVSDICGVARPV